MCHNSSMTTTQQLNDLAERVSDAERELVSVRAERDRAIAAAATEGMRQRDIVEATRLTREQVRRIVRAAEGGAA